MSLVVANPKARTASIRAVITRADGTIEDLGLISYYNKNPIKRWVVNCWIKLKELRNDRSRSK